MTILRSYSTDRLVRARISGEESFEDSSSDGEGDCHSFDDVVREQERDQDAMRRSDTAFYSCMDEDDLEHPLVRGKTIFQSFISRSVTQHLQSLTLVVDMSSYDIDELNQEGYTRKLITSVPPRVFLDYHGPGEAASVSDEPPMQPSSSAAASSSKLLERIKGTQSDLKGSGLTTSTAATIIDNHPGPSRSSKRMASLQPGRAVSPMVSSADRPLRRTMTISLREANLLREAASQCLSGLPLFKVTPLPSETFGIDQAKRLLMMVRMRVKARKLAAQARSRLRRRKGEEGAEAEPAESEESEEVEQLTEDEFVNQRTGRTFVPPVAEVMSKYDYTAADKIPVSNETRELMKYYFKERGQQMINELVQLVDEPVGKKFGWKDQGAKNGVDVFKSDNHVMRSHYECDTFITPEQLMEAIRVIPSHDWNDSMEYFTRLITYRNEEKLDQSICLLSFFGQMGQPGRYFITCVRMQEVAPDHWVMAMESVPEFGFSSPDELKGSAIDGRVFADANMIGYDVRKTPEGKLRVRLIANVDLKTGMIPSWIVNHVRYSTVLHLKQLVKAAEVYQRAKQAA